MSNEIDRELAEMCGWTDFRTFNGPNAEAIWAVRPGQTLRERIPRPSSDPGDALRLLEYVSALPGVGDSVICNRKTHVSSPLQIDKWFCAIACDSGDTDPLTLGNGWDDKITEAIALACRDALRALKEASA